MLENKSDSPKNNSDTDNKYAKDDIKVTDFFLSST